MIDIPPPPDHRWNEIHRSGVSTGPVAYVCAECGERRPRGRAVVLPGALSVEKRDELEQAGYEVVETPFALSGQIVVMDGRLVAAGRDEVEWCVQRPVSP